MYDRISDFLRNYVVSRVKDTSWPDRHQIVRAQCRPDSARSGNKTLKARSRKHPGLAQRQTRFQTTKEIPERHEHLLRVPSGKRATSLGHKATYTYATVSPHQNSLLLFFPPLPHPHHRVATMGAPHNRPCAISAAQTTRVVGGPAGRPRRAWTSPASLPYLFPSTWRKK